MQASSHPLSEGVKESGGQHRNIAKKGMLKASSKVAADFNPGLVVGQD
jgi:hypothetical protein